jgi:hypothetical protein
MVQRRDGAGFPFESFAEVRVARKARREDLDGDCPIEPGVPGSIDLAHSAFAQLGEDFVRAEPGSGEERHRRAIIEAGGLAVEPRWVSRKRTNLVLDERLLEEAPRLSVV